MATHLRMAACAGGLLLSGSGETATETLWTLRGGYSWTDNLEVQSGTTNDRRQQDLSRQGIDIGLSALHQSIDYHGGYTLAAIVNHNRGIDGRNDNDITDTAVTATRLLAITPDWLARLSLALRHHDNQPLPLNSHTAATANATIGWLAPQGGGVDIGLRLKQERHDAVADERYTMRRRRLSLSYHFPHPENDIGATLRVAFGWNDADQPSRDHRSLTVGTSLRGIRIGSTTLQAGIDWRQDRYDTKAWPTTPPGSDDTGMRQRPDDMTSNRPMPMPGYSEAASPERHDTTAYLWLEARHRLGRQWWLNLTLSTGQYRSTAPSDNERFHRIALQFSRQL